MLPTKITGTRAKVNKTTDNGVIGVLGRRPRLNLRIIKEIGNRAMTVNQTRENLAVGQFKGSY